MHARMTHLLTTRHGPHDSDMLGQAAARQWSSPTVDNYDWTRRGPLQLMVLHTAVQWSASFCSMCRPRAIARSTSHSACYSTCCEWLFLRLLWSVTGSMWMVPGIRYGQCKHCSGCRGGRALGGAINKDFKVALEIFVFWTMSGAATRLLVNETPR